MKSYLVIGYANYTPKDRINYENSLKHFGYNYKIVGENQKWINFMESKIKSCYEYVKSLNRKPEIIICTDCFDVLAAQTSDKLISEFEHLSKKTGKKIVIGMEVVCGGNCVAIEHLQNTNIPFKYVNGGFYMGYRKDILKMWKTMLNYNTVDDQRALGTYVNENSELIYLDTESQFVGNVHNKTQGFFRWDSERNVPYRIDTGRSPYFLHFPGETSEMGLYIDDYGNFLKIKYQSHNFTDMLNALTKMAMRFNIGIALVVLIIVFIISYFFVTNHVSYQ